MTYVLSGMSVMIILADGLKLDLTKKEQGTEKKRTISLGAPNCGMICFLI